MPDLTKLLSIGLVRDSELAHLLAETFNFASQADNEVFYARGGEDWAVRLVYRDDKLVAAERGPALRDADVEGLAARIAAELLAKQEQVIARVILFSSLPVTHALRVDDLLQIIPAPPDAPRPPFLMGEHPFLLEFAYSASTVAWITSSRLITALYDWVLLLNTLLHGHISTSPRTAVHHWMLVPGASPSDLNTQYLQEGYWVPHLVGRAVQFTPSTAAPMAIVPASLYYTRIGIHPGDPLDVAADTGDLIRLFASLPDEDRTRFLRASHWYAQFSSAWHTSVSAAFVALISAIEALLPPEPGGSPCAACGKATGKGPTQRFVEFLEAVVPPSESIDAGARRELYRVRSKLAHGGMLLRMDTEREAFLHPETIAERTNLDRARSLTRHALLNWLRLYPRWRDPSSPEASVAA